MCAVGAFVSASNPNFAKMTPNRCNKTYPTKFLHDRNLERVGLLTLYYVSQILVTATRQTLKKMTNFFT